MKRLFLLLIVLPSLGFCSTVIMTAPNNQGTRYYEAPPPKVHRPNQQQVITVPGSPSFQFGPGYSVPHHSHRRKYNKNGYVKNNHPGTHKHHY